MRFSDWLETRVAGSLNPELDRLRKDEKQLIMSMEMRKDPMTGAVVGINKAGYITAAEELKKVRARIRELEGGEVRESHLYDEDFRGSFGRQFANQYQQAKQGSEQDYSRYADAAQKALSKAEEVAKNLSQKTGVPLPLATALIAAGATGGPAAVPFAALLYFVKQPLMKGANRAFDATWDAGANAVQAGQRMLGGQQQPRLQPEALIQPRSFEEFLEADSWGDWAGGKLGGLAGRAAGNVAGFGGKIAGALKSRIGEIAQYAKNNPKEVARMAFLVGAGAAIGAGVGKITHDIKDLIVQKIRDYGIPQEELAWLRSNVILDKQKDGAYGTKSDSLMSTNKDTYDAYEKLSQTQGSRLDTITVSGEKSSTIPGEMPSGRGFVDSIALRNDAGATGVFNADITPGVFSGLKPTGKEYSDMGDAYRDIAVAMHGSGADAGSTIKAIKGSIPGHELSVDGPSAAAEIRKRLASPDTYTAPAAVAGGVVGGIGPNNPKKKSRA